MQINTDKIVYFHDFCAQCEHYNKWETEDPCFKCLENPVNEFSHRPVYFKARDKKAKARG